MIREELKLSKAKLPEAQVWMGGGEVDLKLRFDVAELVEKFAPAGRPLEFADVTE